MPETTSLGITYPCLGELVTCASLIEFATDTENAIVPVDTAATKARLRPAVAVQWTASTPYTVGVPVIPAFGQEFIDTDNMFTVATPTILTVNTAGTYLINFQSSSNMGGTNTSHKAEILVNGSPVSTIKAGNGFAGAQPPNPITCTALVKLAIGNTISVRVTITGVGNDNTFPRLDATLVSYGGS